MTNSPEQKRPESETKLRSDSRWRTKRIVIQRKGSDILPRLSTEEYLYTLLYFDVEYRITDRMSFIKNLQSIITLNVQH